MSPIHRMKKSTRQSVDKLRLTTKRLKIFVWVNGAGDDDVLTGFCFIADLVGQELGIYLRTKLKKSTNVRVALGTKEANSYRAVVMGSNRYAMERHIASHDEPSYRICLKLLFRSEAERQRYAAFRKECRQQALAVRPGMDF